jgi:hypothetical protein
MGVHRRQQPLHHDRHVSTGFSLSVGVLLTQI